MSAAKVRSKAPAAGGLPTARGRLPANQMRIAVILPAAGSGRRFGGTRPKQFLKLAGVSILRRTLDFFRTYSGVSEIVLAAPARQLAGLRREASRWPAQPPIRIVAGGKTRQESVQRALQAAAPTCDWIAVHDVVRPLVDAELFGALLRQARRTGAAIPGVPVTDTLKRINARGYVEETVPRREYVQVQTPQVFRRELLERAFRRAEEERFAGTDEAMLVERLGVAVRVVSGSRRNLKITVPEDLQWAEWLLKHREGRR